MPNQHGTPLICQGCGKDVTANPVHTCDHHLEMVPDTPDAVEAIEALLESPLPTHERANYVALLARIVELEEQKDRLAKLVEIATTEQAASIKDAGEGSKYELSSTELRGPRPPFPDAVEDAKILLTTIMEESCDTDVQQALKIVRARIEELEREITRLKNEPIRP